MRVLIPGPLRSYTAGAREVAAKGETLREVLRDLDLRFPGFAFRLVDEQGMIRRHIKCFIGRDAAASIAASIGDDEDVMIVCALSGG